MRKIYIKVTDQEIIKPALKEDLNFLKGKFSQIK